MRPTYPLCDECYRPMRPDRATLADHPGTVIIGARGLCLTHYRHAREADSPRPVRPEREYTLPPGGDTYTPTPAPLDLLTGTDWMADAPCAQVGGDGWFPEKGETRPIALRMCNGDTDAGIDPCPVRDHCLDYAMTIETNRELRYGIWGGMNPTQRENLARERREDAA